MREREELRASTRAFTNQRKKSTSRIVDVRLCIEVDNQIINYSSFYPGKMLGSTLNVGNKTDSEQIVELSVDANTMKYSLKDLRSNFGDENLPYSLEGMHSPLSNGSGKNLPDDIVNSEYQHEAWYIENPVSKELTKRITLKLGPRAEQDFIIVVRTPKARSTSYLLSVINIGLLTYADEAFGVNTDFESFLKE